MTTTSRCWLFAVAVALPVITPPELRAQGTAVSGVLTAVWGDPRPGSQEAAQLRWTLTADGGDELEVSIEAALLRSLGGVRGLDGRRVSARGLVRRPLLPGVATLSASTIDASPAASMPAQLGSRPYAIVLCRFKDVPAEPRPPADFATLMGGGYPNMTHYYAEISAGQMNFAGTQVFGWFTLPQPKSYYFDGSSINTSLSRLAADCTAVADATVNFAPFAGIVTQYNANLDVSGSGSAWGGSRFMTLDGSTKTWPFVWMPLWATDASRYGVYAHEIGHSLGLSHSSGPYAAVYDSKWDVMSNAYLRYDGGLAAWLPGQTLAYHKDLLGWIPSHRRVTAGGPLPQTLTLEQSSNPAAGNGPMLVTVPIPGTSDFYTIEARNGYGYDDALPGAAVIIHRVVMGACSINQCARVVDPDNNGNPNDAGAMWLPGETFEDGLGIRVAVNSATPNGWNITVSTGNLLTVAGQGTGGGVVQSQVAAIGCSISGGSTTGTCIAAYYGNPTVTLNATPAGNATFAGWSGACTGTGSCTVAMNAQRSVTALFEAPQITNCTVAAAPAGSGTVAGAGTFACGSMRTVVATPEDGSAFTSWTEGAALVSSSPSYTFALTADRVLVANFARTAHQVTVSPAGDGSGVFTSLPAGISCTVTTGTTSGACSAAFEHDALITLTYSPAAGSVLTGWSACNGAGNACTLTVTDAVAAAASLRARPAALTADRAAAAVLGNTTLTAPEIEYLDAIGNRNGRYDVGDFLALLAQQ